MKKNLFQRMAMPLPELEAYYCEQRKRRFEQGRGLRHIRLREAIYPIFAKALILDRILRKQKITVLGNSQKHSGSVIYACTHIGENDLENIYEVLHRGCWWFVGNPCVLYKSISGLFLYLNGCIMLELADRDDRHIAYLRAVEVLKAGGSLMIYPEGARNGTVHLPVMKLFPGVAKMALETDTQIVPIAIEQYGNRFVINFGDELFPDDFHSHAELTKALRDALATLMWEIWEREGVEARSSLPTDYGEQFVKEFEARIRPYDTLETVERTRFHTKEEMEQWDVSTHLERLIPCRQNAFLFRDWR